MTQIRILLIDDNPDDRLLALRELKRGFFELEVEEVGDLAGWQRALEGAFDLVITDYQLRWSTGLEVLRATKARYPDRPVVMFTNSGSEEIAVEAMKAGLDDYVIKSPRHSTRLSVAVHSALERVRAQRRAELAQRRLVFLAEAGPLLTASLDYEATLKVLTRLTVPELTDCCLTYIVETPNQIRCIDVAHRQPEQEQRLRQSLSLYPPNFDATNSPLVKVLRTGEPVLVSEVSEAWIKSVTQDTKHFQAVCTFAPQSFLCVPLLARGQILGAISLIMVSDRRYGSGDLAFAQDLVHRAALAVDNARLYQDAQETNRVKDEFLAILSHELRTPLNAILGWVQLLRSRQFDPTTTAQALETIERNAQAQAQLIEDLLDISRIIRGRLSLKVQPLNLISVIEAAVEIVRPAAEAKGTQLKLDLDPAADNVYGDPDRLQQVMWNLLSNAVKFTPAAGQVAVGLKRRDDTHVEITVSDTGQGISANFLPYIFERFRQADSSTTRMYGGLGLGLAIVRHLVELHGGTVRADSRGENQGTTFTVALPDAGARDKTEAQSTPSSNNCEKLPEPLLSELWVLVVDDEADTRELLKAVLELAGARVSAVVTVAEALAILAPKAIGAAQVGVASPRQPHILISDIGMPAEDGYALIRRVRALPADQGGRLPAIALTAYATQEDYRKILAAGFQQHLSKPIEPTKLISVIENLLNTATR